MITDLCAPAACEQLIADCAAEFGGLDAVAHMPACCVAEPISVT